MKYILDSSVAFKWAVQEVLSGKAEKLRDEFRQGLHMLLSPDILPIEIGHALTRAERQARISPTDGFALWVDVMSDCPQLIPSLPLMPRAYELSSQNRVGVYDCLYVTLSELEQCELITADQRLVNAFPGFQIVALASL